MPMVELTPDQLRLHVDPAALGFANTAELQDLPLPWIGQARWRGPEHPKDHRSQL